MILVRHHLNLNGAVQHVDDVCEVALKRTKQKQSVDVFLCGSVSDR